jgi:hypothetical protein
MKAYIVTSRIATRVIVPDNFTEDQAIEAATNGIVRNADMGLMNDVEIEIDTECPYNPEFDQTTSSIFKHPEIQDAFEIVDISKCKFIPEGKTSESPEMWTISLRDEDDEEIEIFLYDYRPDYEFDLNLLKF